MSFPCAFQGEQCNVVPDTIDDIVADIGQEEKEEGTVNAHTRRNHMGRSPGDGSPAR